MQRTKKRSWLAVAAATALTAFSLIGLGTTAQAEQYAETFDGGTIHLNFGPPSNTVGASYGGIFANSYNFNTQPGIWHAYNHMNDEAGTTNEWLTRAGGTSGLRLEDTVGDGAEGYFMADPTTQTYTANNGQYTYEAHLTYRTNNAVKIYYKVVTTVDSNGKIMHEATIKNEGTARLPEKLVMEIDTNLDNNDHVPLYMGQGAGEVYMQTKPDPLRFDLKAESSNIEMSVGHFGSGYTKGNASSQPDLTGVRRTLIDGSLPVNKTLLKDTDSTVFYLFKDSDQLEPNGAAKTYKFSERLSLSKGTIGGLDELGNEMLIVDGPETPQHLYNPDKLKVFNTTDSDDRTPVAPMTAPEIPGYTYAYAQAYEQDEDGEFTKPIPNILFLTPEHRLTADEKSALDPVGYRTTTNPVYGIYPEGQFRVKFFYRPVNNKDANPNTTTPKPNKPGKPETPVTPESPITPEISTPVAPAPSVRKGEAVYNIQKVGLYKSVNFSKSNLIKAYNKRARTNRYEFIVRGYGYSKTGALRYYVQQYNPHKNQFVPGTKGYITASAKYVSPVYYKATGTKRVKVINPKGIKAYANKQLTNYKKFYKKGTTLKVKRVVTQKKVTRFQLSNGLYITGNKKFVIFK